jgi:hypothetical protein
MLTDVDQCTGLYGRDLVYILYPEVVDTAGLAEARDTVPDSPTLEHTLQVKFCYTASRPPYAHPI